MASNGIELRVLREVVYKRNGRVPKEQKPFAGVGVRYIGKLMGADPELLRQNLAVPLCLGEQNKEVRVLKDVFNLRAGKEVLHILR